MKFRSKRAVALALAILVLLPQVAAVRAQRARTEVSEESFRRITNRLMCQCGSCNYLVLSCNHVNCSSSTYISKTVRNALAEGQSEEAILASLVEQYGPRILAEPPREGFTWLGWIMPYVALLLGGGAVAVVLWRWKSGAGTDTEGSEEELTEPGHRPPAPEQAAALVAKYRAEIDRELDND